MARQSSLTLMKRCLKVRVISREMTCMLFQLYILDISNTCLSGSTPMLGREPGTRPPSPAQAQATTRSKQRDCWLATLALHGFTLLNSFCTSSIIQQRAPHSTNSFGQPGRARDPSAVGVLPALMFSKSNHTRR
jgi:hypothetical protein